MYIGIDIGGTSMRVGLLDASSSTPTLVEMVNSPADQEYRKSVNMLESMIQELLKNHHLDSVEGIGCGVPAAVDSETGVMSVVNNLPEWTGENLQRDLGSIFQVPVKVVNDAALAALGEAVYGEGKNDPLFFYVIWGTGIGGTLIKKSGTQVMIVPGEFGHHILVENGPECHCGQRGCVESFIGGWAFAEHYKVHPSEVQDEQIWDEVADKAAFAMTNITNISLTPKIIFGGGFILKQTHLLQKISQKLLTKLKGCPQPVLALSQFGEHSALYGSVALFTTPLL